MSSSNIGKVCYALGLFVRVSDLEGAVKEFGAAGLPLDQVKLIAPPEQSGSDRHAWSDCGLTLGVDTWVVSAAASGACPWNFAAVRLERTPAEGMSGTSKRDVMPDFHIWALERHAQQLDRHLRGGGAIAVVEVKTDSEERAAYSTLLRHATAGVQTHEISRHH